MNLRARLVLDDCRIALEQLEAAESPALFRVRYAACCALLRTVGYVLRKVDAASSSHVQVRVEAAWARWNAQKAEHSLFWEFIDNERHRILKEYKLGFVYGEHMVLVESPSDADATPFVLGPDLYVPLDDGEFAGEDVRDLIRNSIAWWDQELGTVEGT